MIDFFQPEKLEKPELDEPADLNIIYGAGAKLAGIDGLHVYIDLSKNELQFRAWAKAANNLGATQPEDIKTMYERFYFID